MALLLHHSRSFPPSIQARSNRLCSVFPVKNPIFFFPFYNPMICPPRKFPASPSREPVFPFEGGRPSPLPRVHQVQSFVVDNSFLGSYPGVKNLLPPSSIQNLQRRCWTYVTPLEPPFNPPIFILLPSPVWALPFFLAVSSLPR